jgi:probable addiction module antidote protein
VYLNEHLTYKGPDRLKHLLQAIRDIGSAYGFTRISRVSGLSRRTLYKAFSRSGNPSLATVLTVLAAVGLGIRFDTTKGRLL